MKFKKKLIFIKIWRLSDKLVTAMYCIFVSHVNHIKVNLLTLTLCSNVLFCHPWKAPFSIHAHALLVIPIYRTYKQYMEVAVKYV